MGVSLILGIVAFIFVEPLLVLDLVELGVEIGVSPNLEENTEGFNLFITVDWDDELDGGVKTICLFSLEIISNGEFEVCNGGRILNCVLTFLGVGNTSIISSILITDGT